MSTNDVPGAKSANGDDLAMGCWAEHKDGSLIFVESTEGDSVVYSIFDVAAVPIIEYRDRMSDAAFKQTFSWPGRSGEQWTWHDKTPFPWDRVIKAFPQGARFASVDTVLTAAQRVAERLGLRGRTHRNGGDMAHRGDQKREVADLLTKLQEVIQRLPI